MIKITINLEDLDTFIISTSPTECGRLVKAGLVQGMELGTAEIQRNAVINAPKRTGLLASSIQKAVYEEMPSGWGT